MVATVLLKLAEIVRVCLHRIVGEAALDPHAIKVMLNQGVPSRIRRCTRCGAMIHRLNLLCVVARSASALWIASKGAVAKIDRSPIAPYSKFGQKQNSCH